MRNQMNPVINYPTEYQLLAFMITSMAQITAPLVDDLKMQKNAPEVLLFSRMTMSSMSIFTLLPKAAEEPNESALADIASIASLIRDVVDAFNFLHFVSLDDVSEDEKEFRRVITLLHFLIEQLEVGRGLCVPVEETEGHTHQIEVFKNLIKSHRIYSTLNRDVAKGVMSGVKPFYVTRTQIAERRGANTPLLGALYKILSSHTHSFTYGLYLIFQVHGFGSDSDSARERIAGFLFLLNYYLAAASCGIIRVFPKFNGIIDDDSMKLLTTLSTRFQLVTGTP